MMLTFGMVKRLPKSVSTNYETEYGMKAYIMYCDEKLSDIIKPPDLETIRFSVVNMC
jgi:hypothetical protein